MSDVTVSGGRGAQAPLDASSFPDISGASEVRDWFTLLKPRVLTLVQRNEERGFVGKILVERPDAHARPLRNVAERRTGRRMGGIRHLRSLR